MMNCGKFYNLLVDNGIDFFTGVPDSLLKDFCAYVFDNTDDRKNIVAANEGNAVALAAGYHLATGKTGLVYMQNSGQGNAANPLISLADPDVYSIPMLLMIGWRGEPGKKDEPQHVKQGKITLDFLDALGISWKILSGSIDEAEKELNYAVGVMRDKSMPFALVIPKDTFESYSLENSEGDSFTLLREDAVKMIVDKLGPEDIVVSTTGKTSRELFEYREELGQDHGRDFLTVGSMGHSSQIALGIALAKPKRRVICLDGDGSLIMHMGALAIIASKKPENYKHIVINNGAHDSVGGQPTAGYSIDIPGIAGSCGYISVHTAANKEELEEKLPLFLSGRGPSLLEIKTRKGAREELGRPTTTPVENKNAFMKFLKAD